MMRALLLLLLLAVAPAQAQTGAGVAAMPGVGNPAGLLVSQVTTGGVAVTIMPAGWMAGTYAVCDIVNPPTSAGTLYIDPTTAALAGAATSIPVQPGQAYRISRPISSPVSAVAADSGHPIVGICY